MAPPGEGDLDSHFRGNDTEWGLGKNWCGSIRLKCYIFFKDSICFPREQSSEAIRPVLAGKARFPELSMFRRG